MSGVTSIQLQESLEELEKQLSVPQHPSDKEHLQVLYWLKQEDAPSISTIAKALGKHRNTVGSCLRRYREGGLPTMLERTSSPGRPRIIPHWQKTP